MYLTKVTNRCRIGWLLLLLSVTYYLEAIIAGKRLLSESVAYYEPLDYSQSTLLQAHTRVRKSLNSEEELRLDFMAHGRMFKLCLKRESLLFSHDLFMRDDNVQSFNSHNIYEGKILNEPLSYIHGFIHDNIFEGRIHCNDGNEYDIESAKQYNELDHKKIHSIIYNVKDVIHVGPYHCGETITKHEPGKPGRVNPIKREELDLSSLTFDGKIKNDGRRKRRAVDLKPKLVCELHLRADPTYVNYANSDKNRAMYLMSQHVKSVTNILESTDFNGDEVPDGYTLAIKRIGTIDISRCTSNSTSSNCKFAKGHIGAAKFLDLVSTDDHSAYCLSYVFSHRNFDDGILGLAFTGFPNGEYPGGICDDYSFFNGVKKTLNTGIISNTVYGRTVSKRVTDIALAHEIAHNFGSGHDLKGSHTCVPGGLSGNYLMYSQAQYGTDKNNALLSPCSKAAIWKNIKANSYKCFKGKSPICGNRIVEPGEECDCGYATEDSCLEDQCCQGASPDGYFGCKHSNKAKKNSLKNRCSPSQGLCCNPETCKPFSNNTKECSRTDECSKASKCIDSTYECQPAEILPERTFCNQGNNICIHGECLGSLCLLENKIDCQCTGEDNVCQLCCQDNTNSSSCHVFKLNGQNVKRPTGSPCNHYEGRCNILSKCQNVDETGVLDRLRKWLFHSPSFLNIYEWAKGNWWACILIGLGIILFIMAFVWSCKRFVPSDGKQKRKPGRPFLCINRNPENTTSSPSSNSDTSTRNYLRTPSEEPPQYDDAPPGYNTAVRDNLRYPPSYELEIRR